VTRILATLAVLTAVLTGCGPAAGQVSEFESTAAPDAGITAPLTNQQINAARTEPGPPVLTVATNGAHVTGLPYPTACIHLPGDDPKLPTRVCTPGSVRGDITDATICAKGWSTDTIRPPKAETDRLKTAVMRAQGVPESQRASTELDHLVPLELGGSNDVTNFWAQPSDIPGARPAWRNTKDRIEGDLRDAVCSHQVTLAAAQWAIAVNWATAETTLGLHTR
jgi:hypothetical protein